MTISMYQASVPAFERVLTQLDSILDKAAAHAESKKIDPSVLLHARLYPDMFTCVRQVQIVTDFCKGASSRLAGKDVPSWADDETTIPEIKARIAKARSLVSSFTASDIDGSEDRAVSVKWGPETLTFKGQPYLLHFVLPNLYFHAGMAYAILRHNGVPLGKADFVGNV